MDTKDLLRQAREIWGEQRLSLGQILVRLGVDYGDLCRYERNANKDQEAHTDETLKTQMGNILFSMFRWCDDLGYDPEECIQKAIESQKKFIEQTQKR